MQADIVHVGTFRTVGEIIGRFDGNPRPDLFDAGAYTGEPPDLNRAWNTSGYERIGYLSLTLKRAGTILLFKAADWGSVESSTYYALFQDGQDPLVLRHVTLTDGDALDPPVTTPPHVIRQVQKYQAFLEAIAQGEDRA